MGTITFAVSSFTCAKLYLQSIPYVRSQVVLMAYIHIF